MPKITQENLEHKLSLFLKYAGENESFDPKICVGFAFMNFRADVMGLEDQNLKRMQKLVNTEDSAIREMATLYKNYKNTRRTLFMIEPIFSSNVSLKEKKKQLVALKKEDKPSALLQKEIFTIKYAQDLYINETLKLYFKPDQLNKIQEAEDIYIYLHMLLAAFDPSDYHYEVKGYAQSAYAETLQLLASVEAKESGLKVNKVFEIAFNFTEQELIDLFSDDSIIHLGDYIRLGSSGHAMYLSYRDGVFQLFDPGPIELQGNTPIALVEAIKYRLYTRYQIDTNYMSIAISIFEKPLEEEINRPEAASVIEAILSARGQDHNINKTYNVMDNTSSVYMAAKFGHEQVIDVLAKAKADLNFPNRNGHTPAIIAAYWGHHNVIKTLYDCGADLNKKNSITGETPLGTAIKEHHLSTLKTLIECGARFDIKDQYNMTPLDYANQKVLLFIESCLQHELQKIENEFKEESKSEPNKVTFHFAAGHEEAIKAKQKKLRENFLMRLDQYASLFASNTSKLKVYQYYQQSPLVFDKTGAENVVDGRIQALQIKRNKP